MTVEHRRPVPGVEFRLELESRIDDRETVLREMIHGDLVVLAMGRGAGRTL